MTIDAFAWKTTMEKGTSHCVYRMQVNGVTNKNQKTIYKELNDWKETGYGFNPKTGKEYLFFSRDFGTTDKWMEWAKSFSGWKLVELDKNGKIKKYVRIGARKIQASSAPEKKQKGKRKKRVEKGPRKCSFCGESGHNARTCQAKK